MEDHHFVDAINEFGTEIGFYFAHHCQLDDLIIISRHLLNHLGTEVGSHDNNSILEIHGASLSISHASIIKHLQQNIEYIRMRLFNLVQQNYRIRFSAHRFGEMAAFLIADITGRCADQARNRVFFHKLGHVDANQMIFGIKQKTGQRLA